MKKVLDYGFDEKEEWELYEAVGKKSQFHTYSEWENYVLRKYNNEKYTNASLKNFVHYLRKKQRVVLSKKESWSTAIMPMIILIITILFTSLFSVIGVINNYNNAINTCTGEEFMKYTGYSVQMIYEALEQNLYTGMHFYIIGMIIMTLIVISIIIIMSSILEQYSLKGTFYHDYIQIIEQIVEE